MTLFYILVLIMLTGAGAIAWILIAEKKKESPSEKPLKTSEPQRHLLPDNQRPFWHRQKPKANCHSNMMSF